jgi:hypothetical protein
MNNQNAEVEITNQINEMTDIMNNLDNMNENELLKLLKKLQ